MPPCLNNSLTSEQRACLAKEQEIIDLMIGIHCKGKHERGGAALCPACTQLQEYTVLKNEQCPFLLTRTKTFCQFCSVHCYSDEQREAIIVAMRYAGPRMLWHRPVYALKHLLAVRKHRKSTP
jgi:hypothetical protein